MRFRVLSKNINLLLVFITCAFTANAQSSASYTRYWDDQKKQNAEMNKLKEYKPETKYNMPSNYKPYSKRTSEETAEEKAARRRANEEAYREDEKWRAAYMAQAQKDRNEKEILHRGIIASKVSIAHKYANIGFSDLDAYMVADMQKWAENGSTEIFDKYAVALDIPYRFHQLPAGTPYKEYRKLINEYPAESVRKLELLEQLSVMYPDMQRETDSVEAVACYEMIHILYGYSNDYKKYMPKEFIDTVQFFWKRTIARSPEAFAGSILEERVQKDWAFFRGDRVEEILNKAAEDGNGMAVLAATKAFMLAQYPKECRDEKKTPKIAWPHAQVKDMLVMMAYGAKYDLSVCPTVFTEEEKRQLVNKYALSFYYYNGLKTPAEFDEARKKIFNTWASEISGAYGTNNHITKWVRCALGLV